MAEYRLSVHARSQLLDIFEFTVRTFGQYQAEAYHAGLERTFSLLADFPASDNQLTTWRRDIVDFVSNPIRYSTQKKLQTS